MMTISSTEPARRVALLVILFVTMIHTGCGNGESEKQTAEAQEPAVEILTITPEQEAMVLKAAAVANAIEKAPETMIKVLADNNLSADEYKSLMYRISADPEMSRLFEKSR